MNNQDLLHERRFPGRHRADGRARDDGTRSAPRRFTSLCEEVIALRETNKRQHKLFEQTLTKVRDELKTSFNSFAADTQRAYQQLRQETHGEKNSAWPCSTSCWSWAMTWSTSSAARRRLDDAGGDQGLGRGRRGAVAQGRGGLLRHGIQPYDAVIGSPYNPALHERVGSTRIEGMGPLLVAEQHEPGYASQQPEFVLRRPKVIVSE